MTRPRQPHMKASWLRSSNHILGCSAPEQQLVSQVLQHGKVTDCQVQIYETERTALLSDTMCATGWARWPRNVGLDQLRAMDKEVYEGGKTMACIVCNLKLTLKGAAIR